MSKTSPVTTQATPNAPDKAEWIDVSADADAPNNIVANNHAARADEPPVWSLYLRYALVAFVIVWLTQYITTRRIIAERPPLRIDTNATVAPPRDNTKTLLSASEKATPIATKIVVHITGAVKKPGVYEIGPRARLRDAVHLAGGPLSDADLEAVNLAEFLSDGQQYAIPKRNEKLQTAAPANAEISSARTSRSARTGETAPKVTVKVAPRAPQNTPPSAPLDLNSATAIELDALPDIGPAKAARIIEYRSQNGAFKSVEDLVEVEGIGEKTLEKLRPYVVLR